MDDDELRGYEERYLADRGFEATMVRARRRRVLELAAGLRPARVLEIGSGTDSLYEHTRGVIPSVRRWVTVEPGERFARLAADQERIEGVELRVVHGFFEARTREVAEALGAGADVVLCLGVLQGIEDPQGWLAQLRDTLAPGASVVLTVANALSLHRRLARAMGLIDDEHELSERDRSAFHHAVFDAPRLRAVVEAAGFAVREEGGYLVKPFSHAQMARIADVLTDDVVAGLWTMGRELPELASEIYVVADAV